MVDNQNQWNWLAIASFVLALVWVFFCMTIIWLPLWVICILLALIFGIIALCKKQTLWAALIGTIISWLITLVWIISTISLWTFVSNHSDQIVDPIKDFATWAEANPQVADMLNDPATNEQFEELLEQRMEEIYWEDFDQVKDIDWLLDVWASLFGEMENVLTELSTNAWTPIIDNPDDMMIDEKDNEELNILDTKDIVEETVEETVDEIVE